MSGLKDYDIMDIEAMDDERLEKSESGRIQVTRVYIKAEADKVIADLEESHKKEVGQLLMEIVGLKKLVETADKLLKPKGGFTIKNVTFGGVELEGMKTHKKEETK